MRNTPRTHHAGWVPIAAVAATTALSGCRTPQPLNTRADSEPAAVVQYVLEDFEAPWGWSLDSCNNYGTLRYVADPVTRGERALELDCRAGGRANTMYRCETDWDLSNAERMWLDIHNDSGATGIELALAFRTKQGGFFEMKPRMLQPGWNRDVEFDAGTASLKDSGQSDTWTAQRRTVTRAMLMVSPGKADRATLTVDNWRVDQSNANRKPRPTLTGIPLFPTSIPLRQSAELSLRFSRDSLGIDTDKTANIEVRAHLRSPSGNEKTVNAFPLVSDDENLTFAARFYAAEEGIWQATLAYQTGGVWTNVAARDLQCVASESRGIVRVDSRDGTQFALESGEPFYPIGQNVCWTGDYEPYLKALSEQGGNLVRVWICPWNHPLLDENGPGTFNEESARAIDRLFELARQYEVRVQLVLAYHGWLRDDWARNPFNAANGGPCTLAQEFWQKPGARQAFKRYLEYCVHRWASYPELFAWELVNETDLTPRYDDAHIIDWHREMSDYVTAADPYDHLVTTTLCSGNSLSALWRLPSIDFCSSHIYNPDVSGELLKEWRRCAETRKPYFVTEIGRGWQPQDDQVDPTGRHLHLALWLAWMTPAAGNCLPWWWDTFIEPNGLIRHVGALAAFDEGEDRRAAGLTAWTESLAQPKGPAVEVQGLAGRTRVYGFVYDRERMLDPSTSDTGLLLTRPRELTVDGMIGGEYELEYWDTAKGLVTGRATVTCVNGQLVIPLPKTSSDFAFKAGRKGLSDVRVRVR